MIRQRVHYTAEYLINPQHPITINVIGAGGNGSQVLTQLARIDHALRKLDHIGLHISCYDDDIVTDANLGRQLFSKADLGMNKSVVLVTRINQYFGSSWKAYPIKFDKTIPLTARNSNITITCVDSVSARKNIEKLITPSSKITKAKNLNGLRETTEPFEKPYYWMDLGNSQSAGQFVIGTLCAIKQPKGNEAIQPIGGLATVFEKYPDFRTQKTKSTGPSCSLAEALQKQDLFINSFLVQAAMATLWKMFREAKIDHHGAFINLKTLSISPIYI